MQSNVFCLSAGKLLHYQGRVQVHGTFMSLLLNPDLASTLHHAVPTGVHLDLGHVKAIQSLESDGCRLIENVAAMQLESLQNMTPARLLRHGLLPCLAS